MTRSFLLALILRVALAVAAGAAAATARGDDSRAWTAQDTAMEVAVVAVTTVDYLQTRTDISRRCDEANVFLGPCPNATSVDVYFASYVALHALVAVALPRPWRTVWQSLTLGVEGQTVYRNFVVGARIRF